MHDSVYLPAARYISLWDRNIIFSLVAGLAANPGLSLNQRRYFHLRYVYSAADRDNTLGTKGGLWLGWKGKTHSPIASHEGLCTPIAPSR